VLDISVAAAEAIDGGQEHGGLHHSAFLLPSKQRVRRRMKGLQSSYGEWRLDWEDVKRVIASTEGHLRHGHTYRLRARIVGGTGFVRKSEL